MVRPYVRVAVLSNRSERRMACFDEYPHMDDSACIVEYAQKWRICRLIWPPLHIYIDKI